MRRYVSGKSVGGGTETTPRLSSIPVGIARTKHLVILSFSYTVKQYVETSVLPVDAAGHYTKQALECPYPLMLRFSAPTTLNSTEFKNSQQSFLTVRIDSFPSKMYNTSFNQRRARPKCSETRNNRKARSLLQHKPRLQRNPLN